MENLFSNSGAKCKGIHIFSICDSQSENAQWLEARLEEVRLKREEVIRLGIATEKILKDLWDEFQFYKNELFRKFLLREKVVENTTTTVGRSVIARRLAGNNTYSGNITHTALGTSATAEAITDTQLGTETYRKALSSGTFANNVAYIETFYTAAEVSGTFEEYGNFIDGSSGADTGQLFNRFTTTTVKSNVETLNVQSTITVNDA